MTMTMKVAGGLLTIGLALAALAPASVEAGSRHCRKRSRAHYDSHASYGSYYDGRHYDNDQYYGYSGNRYVDYRAPYVAPHGSSYGYSGYYQSRPRHVVRPYRSYRGSSSRYSYRPSGVHVDIHLGF